MKEVVAAAIMMMTTIFGFWIERLKGWEGEGKTSGCGVMDSDYCWVSFLTLCRTHRHGE